MSKVILHIDMDAYFASVAMINDPKLRGKPVAVGGSSSRSIITTASYEARKYGVKSGMPTFMARKLCRDLVIVPTNFELYKKYTNAFIDIIKKYSPIIQVASIDECYVDITESIPKTNQISYIRSIQDEIYNKLGLTCSIGVAPNKFLAKMASDYQKPRGLSIFGPHNIEDVLWKIDISDMYGIGKKSASYLKSININTIGEFANFENQALLKSKFGKSYYTLYNWSHGIASDEVSVEEHDLKSVGNSFTLNHSTNDYNTIKEGIKDLSKEVSERANKDHLYGNTVQITIKFSDFKVINRSKKLKDITNSYEDILIAAMELVDANYDYEQEIRLLGVTLQNVNRLEHFVKQLSLFDENFTNYKKENSKQRKIIEEINKKIGKEKLMFLSDIKK